MTEDKKTNPESKEVKKEEPKAEKLAKEIKETKTTTEKSETPSKKTKAKKRRTSVQTGNAYIQASYNNTIVTLTEPNGSVIAWSSSGASGFKGARKSTPYAAQVSAENAATKAKVYGLERVHIYIKGVGSGREQAVRGLTASGLDVLSISDTTPIPHNGCRKKKARRV